VIRQTTNIGDNMIHERSLQKYFGTVIYCYTASEVDLLVGVNKTSVSSSKPDSSIRFRHSGVDSDDDLETELRRQATTTTGDDDRRRPVSR